jgi:hypothetical protein
VRNAAYGYLDFVGADGSAAGVVISPPVNSVISCEVCHNANAIGLESVTFLRRSSDRPRQINALRGLYLGGLLVQH